MPVASEGQITRDQIMAAIDADDPPCNGARVQYVRKLDSNQMERLSWDVLSERPRFLELIARAESV